MLWHAPLNLNCSCSESTANTPSAPTAMCDADTARSAVGVGGSTVGQTGNFFTQLKLLARGSGGCMAQRPEARWPPQSASKGPAHAAALAGDGHNPAC